LKRFLRETLFRETTRVCGLVCAAIVVTIFAFLVWFSLPLLREGQLAIITSLSWRPFHGQFGILPMIAGSLSLAIPTIFLAFPLALGICLFAHGLGPKLPGKAVMALVHFMTSIPTVVYGFAAVFLLIPLLRETFARGSGFSWLAAMLALTVLVLPTIILFIHTQFTIVEPEINQTTQALGMTDAQRLLWVTLPLSRRGLMAGGILGFGRAIGDTMIPLMLSGNAPIMPGSPLASMRTMTAHIALVVATDSQDAAYASLFACGVILFLTTFAVNLGLRKLTSNDTDTTGVRP
jgi:phosphate transport system permease protein